MRKIFTAILATALIATGSSAFAKRRHHAMPMAHHSSRTGPTTAGSGGAVGGTGATQTGVNGMAGSGGAAGGMGR